MFLLTMTTWEDKKYKGQQYTQQFTSRKKYSVKNNTRKYI